MNRSNVFSMSANTSARCLRDRLVADAVGIRVNRTVHRGPPCPRSGLAGPPSTLRNVPDTSCGVPVAGKRQGHPLRKATPALDRLHGWMLPPLTEWRSEDVPWHPGPGPLRLQQVPEPNAPCPDSSNRQFHLTCDSPGPLYGQRSTCRERLCLGTHSHGRGQSS